jgi:hypothetical protein
MKQYTFTVKLKSSMDVKDILWAFTHKLKDAFKITSITFDEISDRPTTIEHHGGVESDLKRNGVDLDRFDNYDKIPERY